MAHWALSGILDNQVPLNPCPAEPGLYPSFANSVDPEEANWSGSTLFAIKYVNL